MLRNLCNRETMRVLSQFAITQLVLTLAWIEQKISYLMFSICTENNQRYTIPIQSRSNLPHKLDIFKANDKRCEMYKKSAKVILGLQTFMWLLTLCIDAITVHVNMLMNHIVTQLLLLSYLMKIGEINLSNIINLMK